MAEDDTMIDCAACEQEKSIVGSEEVVVDRTYVDHMMVSEETETVCADCVADAEEASLEQALRAREWAGYDRWEARNRG